ncbi:hypothetical protein KOEU_26790 [Komagataeibacter europaeus]|uniref:Uncharacterized protein n=2 Tax=Komagataeibacter europaeus TaxID=33995 RepID=A0A0M0EES8_KOMEU|nr:hypothetical protein KOEU_26790 [Komagataeibacter europaeus]
MDFLIKVKNCYRELGHMLGPDFVGKSFAIAFVLEGLMITLLTQPGRPSHPFTTVMSIAVYTVSSLLFPFTRAGWEAFKDLFASDTVMFIPSIVWLVLSFIVNGMLWQASIFLGPIAIWYLFGRRQH